MERKRRSQRYSQPPVAAELPNGRYGIGDETQFGQSEELTDRYAAPCSKFYVVEEKPASQSASKGRMVYSVWSSRPYWIWLVLTLVVVAALAFGTMQLSNAKAPQVDVTTVADTAATMKPIIAGVWQSEDDAPVTLALDQGKYSITDGTITQMGTYEGTIGSLSFIQADSQAMPLVEVGWLQGQLAVQWQNRIVLLSQR